MEQLLKITSIPIQYQLKVNNARIDYSRSLSDLQIARNRGGLQMKSKQIKVGLDTFEARNSVCPSAMRSIEQAAQKGKQVALEATANYAKEGKMLLSSTLGDEALDQVIASRLSKTSEYGLSFSPSAPLEITWSEPDLSVQYEMDKLSFNWKISKGNFNYIPGSIEVNVVQQPDLLVEYIGSPIYVPPSADPSHSMLDVRA